MARAAAAWLVHARSCFTNGGKSSILLDARSSVMFSIESFMWFSIYPGIHCAVLLVDSELRGMAVLYTGIWSGRGAEVFNSHHIL